MDLDLVRNQFPALDRNFIFMDNAGGTQTAAPVMQRINQYLTYYNVQLGASYKVSAEAADKLKQVVSDLAMLVNAADNREIIVGPSSSMLLRILSLCISRQWQQGDEVIVTNSDHEANVSCWMDLRERGIKVKIWKVNPQTLEFDLNDLDNLLTEKTRLVAMVHVSNILGTINPVRQVADKVHQAGALLCVDGVAYAPHRIIDVQDFDADFYVFSSYKTFGPHQAVMYGKYELLAGMEGINHYFIGKNEVPYKFQPGNVNYELTYSLAGIKAYLKLIGTHHFPEKTDNERGLLESSFDLISEYEENLCRVLLDYLNSRDEIKIIGHAVPDKEKRVATISFIHNNEKSSHIVTKVDPYNIGIRYGDFYAKKIIEDLGLVEKEGIIRVSMVHYNTIAEVQSLINVLEAIL